MGEFLKQYGGIVIAFIVATCLLFLIMFGQEYNTENYSNLIDQSLLNQNYEDINSVIKGSEPELTVQENFVIEKGEKLELSDLIKSAYGRNNVTEDSFYILSRGERLNISDIKERMMAGKVNVVYREELTTDKIGTYTIDFYVKNTTKDGLWDKKTCHISIQDYS